MGVIVLCNSSSYLRDLELSIRRQRQMCIRERVIVRWSSSIFIIIAGRSSRTMQVHFDFGDSQSGLCIKCCNQGGQVFVYEFFFNSC